MGGENADTNGETLIQRVDRLEALIQKQAKHDEDRDNAQAWQSLHMSAAAACRSLTSHGGNGCHWNVVVPLPKGQTCTQTCKNTKTYTDCDGALSIMGYSGKMKTPNQ